MANKITPIELIERANKIHNNKYDYSLIEYKNNKYTPKIKFGGMYECFSKLDPITFKLT